MSKESILRDAHRIGHTARTVVGLTTMMGVGIREDDLGTAIAYSLPVPGRSCQYSNQRSTMLAAKVSML